MKVTAIIAIACAAVALPISSCTNFTGHNVYNKNELGSVQATYTGTVTYVETVKIQSDTSSGGTALGAGAGGVLGAMFGGGSAKFATAAGGMLLGGLIGNQVDKSVNNTTGERITVRLDKSYNGSRDITIVQVANPSNPIQVGGRVRVMIGNKASRVLAY